MFLSNFDYFSVFLFHNFETYRLPESGQTLNKRSECSKMECFHDFFLPNICLVLECILLKKSVFPEQGIFMKLLFIQTTLVSHV